MTALTMVDMPWQKDENLAKLTVWTRFYREEPLLLEHNVGKLRVAFVPKTSSIHLAVLIEHWHVMDRKTLAAAYTLLCYCICVTWLKLIMSRTTLNHIGMI